MHSDCVHTKQTIHATTHEHTVWQNMQNIALTQQQTYAGWQVEGYSQNNYAENSHDDKHCTCTYSTCVYAHLQVTYTYSAGQQNAESG
jgi:hypothetical protein